MGFDQEHKDMNGFMIEPRNQKHKITERHEQDNPIREGRGGSPITGTKSQNLI